MPAMTLYLDCSSGIAGDMLLAALADVLAAQGVGGEAVLLDALSAVGIDPGAASLERVMRGGFAARRLVVSERPGFESFELLVETVRRSSLPSAVVDIVAAVAGRMAVAEQAVHGGAREHLHELAGLDTAVDLVGCAALLFALSPGRVMASPPALGRGSVRTAHGTIDVPVPAVLAILRGLPIAGGCEREAGELTTPTGAALFAELVDDVGPLPAGRLGAVGVGAGAREIAGRPNVLRAILVEPREGGEQALAAVDDWLEETVHQVETTIDDATAEVMANAADELRAAGALDVWFTSAQMKKGRPGHVLHMLCRVADTTRLADLLFRETTTFGVRVLPVQRLLVDAREGEVVVFGERVRVRLGLRGGRLITASPEFEDCRALAQGMGLPLKEVMAVAQAAALRPPGGQRGPAHGPAVDV